MWRPGLIERNRLLKKFAGNIGKFRYGAESTTSDKRTRPRLVKSIEDFIVGWLTVLASQGFLVHRHSVYYDPVELVIDILRYADREPVVKANLE